MNIKDIGDPGSRKAIQEKVNWVEYYDEEGDYCEKEVPVVDANGDFETDDVTSLYDVESASTLDGVEKLTKLNTLEIKKYTGTNMTLSNPCLNYVSVITTASSVTFKLPNVTTLSVTGNSALKKVDITAEKLTYLDLSGSKLSTIKCSNPKNLKSLGLYSVPGKRIDVTKYPNLSYLNLSKTKATSIKGLSKLTKLTGIYCYKTKMKSLDLKKNKKLEYADVEYSPLSSISLPSKIQSVYLNNNKLASLDFSKKSKLTSIDVSGNKLTSLKLPSKTRWVRANNNKLTSLNVSKCKELYSLYVGGNKNLKTLDVSKNKKLEYVSVYGTKISKLNLKNKYVYMYFEAKKNKSINIKNYIGSGWTKTYSYGGITYDKKKGTVKGTKKGWNTVYLKKGSKTRCIEVHVK